MNLKKCFTAAALVIALLILFGCAPAKKEVSTDAKKSVTLTMYLLGDKANDFDAVFAQINEKMKSRINATLEVKFLNWSEYETKYPLLFASGEDFDLIYTAEWAFYKQQASKQGFLELTDELLTKYAPLTMQNQYLDSLKQAKVNGKLYMLPMNYKELTGYVYFVRGDLMKKYGIERIDSRADFKNYLMQVKKNEAGMIPYNTGSGFDYQFLFNRIFNTKAQTKYTPVGNYAYLTVADTDGNIINLLDTPELYETVKEIKEWKDAKLWSESAFSNQMNIKESFAAGKSASMLLNLNDAKGQYSKLTKEHPEWDIQVFDAMENERALLNPFTANGMGIFAKSKNPERALAALDLLKNDPEIHNLFSFGIEGIHYKKTDDSHIELTEKSADYAYDGNCNWGIRNDKLWLSIAGGIPEGDAILKKWTDSAYIPPYMGFNFSSDTVKNETAAITEMYGSQYKLLQLGFTADPKSDIQKLKQKYTIAGIERVKAEIEKQLAAFESENKN